jgi:hypothetical protein
MIKKASKEYPKYLYAGKIDGNFPILLPFRTSKGFIFDIGVQEQGLGKIMESSRMS